MNDKNKLIHWLIETELIGLIEAKLKNFINRKAIFASFIKISNRYSFKFRCTCYVYPTNCSTCPSLKFLPYRQFFFDTVWSLAKFQVKAPVFQKMQTSSVTEEEVQRRMINKLCRPLSRSFTAKPKFSKMSFQ